MDDTTAVLEFKSPFGLKYEYVCLKNKKAITIVFRLRSLLVKMFRKHRLQVSQEVDVHIRVCGQWGQRTPPPSWAHEVRGLKIDMDKVGFYRDNFVIWGPQIVFRETGGIYQPFIIVAGLDVSVSKTLRQKGLHGTVLKFLELRVLKRRTFFELEKALDELKRKLDELACPGEMRAKGTARRRAC